VPVSRTSNALASLSKSPNDILLARFLTRGTLCGAMCAQNHHH
jgi:hypothetical protein